MSSALGPFGPGLRRRFGENSIRYFCLLKALWRPSRVEGFSTIADRSRRVGRTKSAIQPARMRSDAHRFGDRGLGRFTIRSWCLRRSDSATMERAPPGPSKRARVAMKWIKRTTQIAHHRIVAGRGILRNLVRNNNSPATTTRRPQTRLARHSCRRNSKQDSPLNFSVSRRNTKRPFRRGTVPPLAASPPPAFSGSRLAHAAHAAARHRPASASAPAVGAPQRALKPSSAAACFWVCAVY
jgi:hypothetical protein